MNTKQVVHKLPNQIKGKGDVSGYTYTQIKDGGTYYVYAVTEEDSPDVSHMEVFMKKTTPICIDFENRLYSFKEVKEIYPKSKDFGRWAFTANTPKQVKEIVEKHGL